MKSQRQDKILELILAYNIGTQEELIHRLAAEGIRATQATVSRDIRELKLTKEMTPAGTYRYIAGGSRVDVHLPSKSGAILMESVLHVDFAQNLVVVKCQTGMANAACAVLDSIAFDGVVGTIAGDDTILLILKTNEEATSIAKEIYKFLNR